VQAAVGNAAGVAGRGAQVPRPGVRDQDLPAAWGAGPHPRDERAEDRVEVEPVDRVDRPVDEFGGRGPLGHPDRPAELPRPLTVVVAGRFGRAGGHPGPGEPVAGAPHQQGQLRARRDPTRRLDDHRRSVAGPINTGVAVVSVQDGAGAAI
jgi:hypothetical protein